MLPASQITVAAPAQPALASRGARIACYFHFGDDTLECTCGIRRLRNLGDLSQPLSILMRDRERDDAVDFHEHALRNLFGRYPVLARCSEQRADAIGGILRALLDRYAKYRRAKSDNRTIEDDDRCRISGGAVFRCSIGERSCRLRIGERSCPSSAGRWGSWAGAWPRP